MLRLEVQADLKSTDVAAARIGDMARQALGADRVPCVEIAVSEALSNIVRHAFAGATGTVLVDAGATPDGFGVTLTDRARPLPQWLLEKTTSSPEELDVGLAENGRGLALIYQCSDEVQFRHAAGTNCLRLLFRGRK